MVGCGRTDAGVHARQYFLHFDALEYPSDDLLSRINKFLPKDIAVHSIVEVDSGAHARFDAVTRIYQYQVHFAKNPFLEDWSFFYRLGKPELHLMNLGAKLMVGEHDFASLSKKNPDLKNTLCTVKSAKWKSTDDGLLFEISANRFLHSMVRRIVGCSLQIGLAQVSLETLGDVVNARAKLPKTIAVPPQGLYLVKVEYPYL